MKQTLLALAFRFIKKYKYIEIVFPTLFLKKIYAYGLFISKSLQYSNNGYWWINPMPSKNDLDLYYRKFYYLEKQSNSHLTERDIFHYQILLEEVPKIVNGGLVFLNFGAGVSGISELVNSFGNKVINIEPSSVLLSKNQNVTYLKDITELREKIDIFYASHSLEHVTDIESLENTVNKMLRKGGVYFAEVPNANFLGNGGADGKICEPHTYYFEEKYFQNLKYRGRLYPIPQKGNKIGGPEHKSKSVLWFIGVN